MQKKKQDIWKQKARTFLQKAFQKAGNSAAVYEKLVCFFLFFFFSFSRVFLFFPKEKKKPLDPRRIELRIFRMSSERLNHCRLCRQILPLQTAELSTTGPLEKAEYSCL